ncbi:hypothetical protein ACINWCA157_1304 [Acinetobacter radioresistens WC-A-157]|nr:hypothetical protein ACINWCA157_1304 [Acinetobacter radioresistens WC-A-157]
MYFFRVENFNICVCHGDLLNIAIMLVFTSYFLNHFMSEACIDPDTVY